MPRQTIRVAGENIGINDCVTMTFHHEEIVVSVAVVGWVKRIRCYDEFNGENVEPEVWIRDDRSGHLIGPLKRSNIESVHAVDGPWQTDKECSEQAGEPFKTSIDNGYVD